MIQIVSGVKLILYSVKQVSSFVWLVWFGYLFVLVSWLGSQDEINCVSNSVFRGTSETCILIKNVDISMK